MTNRQRFDKFIVKYISKARAIALGYVENPEDADELVADSIAKALSHIDDLDNLPKIRPWFNTIVINTAIDFLRTKHEPEIFPQPSYYYDDLSRLFIEDLIKSLPPCDRQILLLRFIDNCSLREIAAALGMNENTVKTRLYRSLRKLRLTMDN